MELLERDAFLDALAGYADEALLGQGRVVLLGGEAGVGKTALVEAFQSRMPGARWAWGACDDLSTPRPLAPLYDVAPVLGGSLLEAVRRDDARDVLFDELVTALGTGDELTVVVIEDLHWADEATLDMVKHVSRRLASARALLLVTYRDDELAGESRLRRLLGDIGSHRSARRMALPPLSEQAVLDAAAGTPLSGAELYRLTAGNPYYVSEVLAADTDELPASVRDAVLARASRLSPEGRHALEVAATVGSRANGQLLSAVEGVSAEGIDECVRAGMLVDADDALAFRHDLARLAIFAALPPRLRARLHAAVLAALGETADDALLAHHADGAGDSARVLRHASAAGAAASRVGAHIEAAQQYRRALKHSASLPPRELAELLELLAEETSAIDELEESVQAREKALALWQELGDELRVGAAKCSLSVPLWQLARGAEAQAMAEEAVTHLRRLPAGPELARALFRLSGLRFGQGEIAEALELCREAKTRARELSLRELVVGCLNNEACYLVALGEDGLPMLQEAVELAVTSGLDLQAARAYTNLHEIQCLTMQLADADATYAEAVSYFEAHDVETYAACVVGDRVASLARQGRTAEARSLNDELLSKKLPSPVNRLGPVMVAGLLAARAGETAAAWEALDEMLSLAVSLDEPTYISRVNLARAEAHWLERDPLRAAEEARAGATVLSGPDPWEAAQALTWCRRTGVSFDAPSAWPKPAGPWVLELAGDHRGAAAEWDRLGAAQMAAMALAFSAEEADLLEAVERFAAMDAPATAARVRQRLREVGAETVPVGPRAATRAHPAGLTRRESEVLDGLVRGLSNAELAAELYLSERTVEHHVSNVLGKLNVSSRADAARTARERGLVLTT